MQHLNSETIVDLENSEFARDIVDGLQSLPKKLPSKYFYDEIGDDLFQQIMELDEYYLTRTEFKILKENKQSILNAIHQEGEFHLYELGAGDGYKTKILLRHFLQEKVDFAYSPIDISGNVLEQLETALSSELPELNVRTLEGDYFEMLNSIENEEHLKKVVLFLGSNIGNFTNQTAISFLQHLRGSLETGDYFLIGADLKKDPSKILDAYNDAKGVTKKFNLNLLHRINEELGANFDLTKYQHYPYYDPGTGECRSYLISTEQQVVNLEALGIEINFKAWEAIHMEISKKYDLDELEDMALAAGFKVVEHFTDDQQYFVDSLWQAR